MASSTPRFKLTTLDSDAESIEFQGWKSTDADRVLLDRLLRYATEGHRHRGLPAINFQFPAPDVTIAYSGGMIPANTVAHYRYTILDENGEETAGSALATIHTPPQVPAPSPPSLAASPGTLLGGYYQYLVTAFIDPDGTWEVPPPAGTNLESLASAPATASLAGLGGWSLTMPPRPSGADGFNVYRRGPTETEFGYVGSTKDLYFEDDGSLLTGNPLRHPPISNATYATNAVTVALPEGLLPPESWTWRIYRTYDITNWDNSLLTWSGPTPTFVDVGGATSPGAPPQASTALGSPPKIDLGSEVQGHPLPEAVTVTRTFNFAAEGPVIEGPDDRCWVSEYDLLELVSLRASLGRDAVPSSQPVIAGLQIAEPGSEIWVDLPDDSQIEIGEFIGSLAEITEPEPLPAGTRFRLIVRQNGGAATPTDHDLALNVRCVVQMANP